MDELLQTNIFFFITSAATIVISIGICILLYFLIPLVRDVRDIAAKFHTAAGEVESDFEKLRGTMQEEGVKTKALLDLGLGFLGHFFYTPPKPRRKRKVKRIGA